MTCCASNTVTGVYIKYNRFADKNHIYDELMKENLFPGSWTQELESDPTQN